jgi:hypothetical protein
LWACACLPDQPGESDEIRSSCTNDEQTRTRVLIEIDTISDSTSYFPSVLSLPSWIANPARRPDSA